MNDLVGDIAVFDGPPPKSLSFADNNEDWPYIRIDIGGGIYNPISRVGEFLEEVSRNSGYNFIKFDGDCRKGYYLIDIQDILSPKQIFSIEIFMIWDGLEPMGRAYILKPNSPRKEYIREYRNKLAAELFERKKDYCQE